MAVRIAPESPERVHPQFERAVKQFRAPHEIIVRDEVPGRDS